MLSTRTFTGRVFIILLMVSAFFLLGYALDFILLVFASILFAVLVSYGANGMERRWKIKYEIGITIVLVGMAALITLVIWFLGPSLSKQVEEMRQVLPESIESFKQRMKENSVGRTLIDEIPEDPAKVMSSKDAFKRIGDAFSTTLGMVANVVIIVVAGIFFAVDPKTYREGFARLFPVDSRKRINEVLIKCYHTLSSWLIAKFISMAIVGVATGIGLMLLGMPLPWALALIAFLFAFVPNIGPYLALAPALLIALMEGPNMALYVTILYFGIQIIESYLVTPLIQKKMLSIPPALSLLWQVLLGFFAGIGGLFIATPILATIIVLVQELYVKDKLENTTKGEM
ncbi:AI-2E family transporter [Flavihumibacter sediminis]|nr:AI-2E family transporter [Flavihumibacter sediminis]